MQRSETLSALYEPAEQAPPATDDGAAFVWLAGGGLLLLSLIGGGLWALWLSNTTLAMVSDLTWFFLCH